MELALEDTRLPLESMSHREIPVRGCSSAVVLKRGETKNSSHTVSDHQRLNSLLQKGKGRQDLSTGKSRLPTYPWPCQEELGWCRLARQEPLQGQKCRQLPPSPSKCPCLQRSQFTLGQPTSSAQSTWGSWVAVIASLEGWVALELSASL